MKRIYILLLLPFFLLSSCENFIDIDLPDNQMVGSLVFQDSKTAEAALAHVYVKLFSEVLVSGSQSGIGMILGAYTDEIIVYQIGISNGVFFLNQITPVHSSIITIWNKSYNLIYAVNAVIEGVENNPNLDLDTQTRLLGEAYFCRAYIHYFLYNLYSDIPYIKTTDHLINRSVSKLSFELFAQNLLEDLKQAAKYLEQVPITSLRVRPSIDAVKMLSARILLQQNKWDQVVIYMDDVINNPIYTWEADINNVFLKESTETIWQLMPPRSGNNAMEGNSNIFTIAPPALAMRKELYDSFDKTDLRLLNWIGTVEDVDGTKYAYSYKYKQSQATATSMEYSVQLRLREAYLMRAEAYILSDQVALGIEDINTIRHHARLTDRITNDKEEAMSYLMKERRHELFCEHGHRFFDLKRWNKLDKVLTPVKTYWKSYYKNFPIPEKEILLNPNLNPQNSGY